MTEDWQSGSHKSWQVLTYRDNTTASRAAKQQLA